MTRKKIQAKNPPIGEYIDDEERELIEDIENSAFDGGVVSILTPERKRELMESARAQLERTRKKITIRVQERDLEKLKAMAAKEGMPYQTLINSILHKAVS